MVRKIAWDTGCYDEIDLVYDKASENPIAASLLSALEDMALKEAKQQCGIISVDNRPLKPEEFDTIPVQVKEGLMAALGNTGLAEFSTTLTSAKLVVRLSPYVALMSGCTAFNILNRLEKLDGSLNMLFPKVELELQVPAGGRSNLLEFETLVALIYPWLEVHEVSSGELSVTMAVQQTGGEKKAQPSSPQPDSKSGTGNSKPGFFSKLFGKR